MKRLIRVCERDVKIQGRLIRVARLDADTYRFLEDPELILDGLRTCGSRIDLFTFVQKLPDTEPRFKYPMEWDNFAVLTVSTFDHWWNKQIGFKARNKAKQAEKKGIIVREVTFDSHLVRGIWEIYNECPIRQGRPFPHYGKDIETVNKLEATYLDSSIFIGAFLDKKLIGFVKLVADETGTQAGTMNIVSMIEHRDKSPTNALIAQAVRSCAERGIRYLVYARFAYGKKERSSISDFKERNGFQRIDIPRYYVPLTRAGHASFCLGLHQKFADRLPECVYTRLLEARNGWYNRRLQTSTESP